MPPVKTTSLNRTFYGIETGWIVFVGLDFSRLNRTFYGIETGIRGLQGLQGEVLIVPFMELKRFSTELAQIIMES